MRDALNVRISYFVGGSIATHVNNTSIITSPTDTDLDLVKGVLNDGYVLTVATPQKWETVVSATYGSIVVRGVWNSQSTGGHAATIVGYNDNVYYDVNGDGVISNSEKGAFKLANSYGTSGANSGTNGYYWVLYDALNEFTSISGDWENAENTRSPIFAHGYGQRNMFYKMQLTTKDVYVIGHAYVNATSRTDLKVNTYKLSSSNIVLKSNLIPTAINAAAVSSNVLGFTGSIIYDMSDLITNLNTDFSNIKWQSRFYDIDLENLLLVTVSDYRLIDNHGNNITTAQNIGYISSESSPSLATNTLNLQKGDLDYDNVIEESEAQLVLSYAVGNDDVVFSNLQFCLADYDGNGVIESSDALSILQSVE